MLFSPVPGRYSLLPVMTLDYDFLHVLLPGDNEENTCHSFRLLIGKEACDTQIFSSKTASWGPVTKNPGPGVMDFWEWMHPVAHWLLHHQPSGRYQVLAIRLSDGHAAGIGEVPELCLRRRRTGPAITNFKDLLLVSTNTRMLGLLVEEFLVISLWTLSEDSKTWGTRRVVVNTINRHKGLALEESPQLNWRPQEHH
jgi:hypothetical protein